MSIKLPSSYIDENFNLTLKAQDIYIIREGGQRASLINYNDYVPDVTASGDPVSEQALRLEWHSSEDDNHQFFETKNGHYPVNLTGPALTKVIDWNLDTANYPPGIDRSMLKPGYLLDLRLLQLNRLHAPKFKFHPDAPTPERDTPIEQVVVTKDDLLPHPVHKPYDGHVPPQKLSQLTDLSKENLYIVSWKNPLLVRDVDKFYPYQITYLSAEQLDKLEQYNLEPSPSDIDLNAVELLSLREYFELEQEQLDHSITDEGKEKLEFNHQKVKSLTGMSLARYFRDSGVQVGAVNPKDVHVELGLVGAVCMVANLQSFLK